MTLPFLFMYLTVFHCFMVGIMVGIKNLSKNKGTQILL